VGAGVLRQLVGYDAEGLLVGPPPKADGGPDQGLGEEVPLLGEEGEPPEHSLVLRHKVGAAFAASEADEGRSGHCD